MRDLVDFVVGRAIVTDIERRGAFSAAMDAQLMNRLGRSCLPVAYPLSLYGTDVESGRCANQGG